MAANSSSYVAAAVGMNPHVSPRRPLSGRERLLLWGGPGEWRRAAFAWLLQSTEDLEREAKDGRHSGCDSCGGKGDWSQLRRQKKLRGPLQKYSRSMAR